MKCKMKKLLVLLIAACMVCMTLGSGAVMAEESNGEDLTVDVGDIVSDADFGVNVKVFEDSAGENGAKVSTGDGEDKNCTTTEPVDSVTVNIGSVEVAGLSDNREMIGVQLVDQSTFDVTINTDNITVERKQDWSGEATGFSNTSNDSNLEGRLDINLGDVSVTTENVTSSENNAQAQAKATGIDMIEGNVIAGDISVTAIAENTTNDNPIARADAKGIHLYSDETISATASLGNIVSKASSKTGGSSKDPYPSSARGIDVSSSNNGIATVKSGKIIAEGDGTKAVGVNVDAWNGEAGGAVTVDTGDMTITSKNDKTTALPDAGSDMHNTAGILVKSQGVDTAVHSGKVSVTADSGAIGVAAVVNTSSVEDEDGKITTNPGKISIVTEDIDANGENSVGIYACGEKEKDGVDPESTIDIVADGTVSGDDVAIKVLEKSDNGNNNVTTFNTDNINITVWAANENSAGEIARVVTTTKDNKRNDVETVDEEASAALEARINYIIKIAEAWKSKMDAAGAKGNSVVIGETKYNTANQDEEVSITVKINPEDGTLEGIYYNVDDEDSFVSIDKITKDSNGNYVFKMLRGGAMMLGMKLRAPAPAPKPEPTPEPEPEPEPTPEPGPEPAAPTAPVTYFSWAPVDPNTVVNGVKAADHQTMAEVAVIVGKTLDEEKASVIFENADKVLNAEEMTQFNQLTIKDRFLVLLNVLGYGDQLEDVRDEMSDDAGALAAAAAARIAALPDDKKPEVDKLFQPSKVTIDGKDYDSIGIALTIDHNGVRDYNRYTFYGAEDAWRLYRIERGEFTTV